MFAAAAADAQALDALLKKGAGLDLTEETHGWTALVYAIWSGDLGTLKTVLEYYPDASIKDQNGRTALDHAILSADLEVIVLILGRPMRGQDRAIGPGPARL
jgi:ankyrin repeat protein